MSTVFGSGDGAFEMRGSALAPITWHDEFGDDGLYDALVRVENGMPMLDVLRVAWVMAHDAAVARGDKPQRFDEWAACTGGVDFSELRQAITKEAEASFFPSLTKAAERRRRARAGAKEPAGGAAGAGEKDGAVD